MKIEVKIKDNQAIVRKTLRYPAKRYGLTREGEWAFVAQGQPYPEQCLLPVIQYDNSHTETKIA